MSANCIGSAAESTIPRTQPSISSVLQGKYSCPFDGGVINKRK